MNTKTHTLIYKYAYLHIQFDIHEISSDPPINEKTYV